MERRLEIDALRGMMLVWMTLVHVPTLLTPWVNQPFGFLSASEGFIFVSALFTGRIYYRLLNRDGAWSMQRKLMHRTTRLYFFHVVLLVLLFTVAASVARSGRAPALTHLLSYYFSVGPIAAMRDGLLLLYRPPLLDIMPLYVTFLFISPVPVAAWRPPGTALAISARHQRGVMDRGAVRRLTFGIRCAGRLLPCARAALGDGCLQPVGLAADVDLRHVVRGALGAG